MVGGARWTDGFRHLDCSGPASARSLPEREGRAAEAVVGLSSLRVGTHCPGSHPPPLGLRGQETRQRWQSSQEGQWDQVEGVSPAWPHRTDREVPSSAHSGLLGGSDHGLEALLLDGFYWGFTLFFNRPEDLQRFHSGKTG